MRFSFSSSYKDSLSFCCCNSTLNCSDFFTFSETTILRLPTSDLLSFKVVVNFFSVSFNPIIFSSLSRNVVVNFSDCCCNSTTCSLLLVCESSRTSCFLTPSSVMPICCNKSRFNLDILRPFNKATNSPPIKRHKVANPAIKIG